MPRSSTSRRCSRTSRLERHISSLVDPVDRTTLDLCRSNSFRETHVTEGVLFVCERRDVHLPAAVTAALHPHEHLTWCLHLAPPRLPGLGFGHPCNSSSRNFSRISCSATSEGVFPNSPVRASRSNSLHVCGVVRIAAVLVSTTLFLRALRATAGGHDLTSN